jgi:alanyl aminopeptidase
MTRTLAVLLIAACTPHPVPVPVPAPVRVPVPVAVPGPRLPDAAAPLAYDLRLEVDPDQEAFTGHVAIRVRLASPADRVWLGADELDLARATFHVAGGPADEPLALGQAGEKMRAFGFGRTLPAGEVTLTIDYTGHTRHDQEGLFRQAEDKHAYVFSQSESAFARRIVPCFDEPRWKAPWKVTLVVPRADHALGNAPAVLVTPLPGGKQQIELAQTPPMASYLLAIAVGPFELVDVGPVGKRKVPARVAALAGQARAVGVVRAKLPAIVDAAEVMFEDDLPLAKLDLVAVPHLFGAMENPGLVTFDQHILAGDVSQPAFVHHFVRVAAHEIVHQWFGDLVTPAWWDDLWLAEAFASWLGDRIADRVVPADDPELHRALAREAALAADAEPEAKPLRPAIARGDDAEDTFDAIAYDKGEIVLDTIMAWQGENAVLGALRAYLGAHRGGTATAQDLYAALGAPAARALASYVEHPGTPIVELALRCEHEPVLAIKVRDQRALPVCVRYGDARTSHRTCQLVDGSAELALEGGCPAWVVGNDGAGYYEVAWPGADPLAHLPAFGQLSHGELIAAGDDVAGAFARGEIGATVALAALDRMAATRLPHAQVSALAIARAIDPVVDGDSRAAWSAWLAHRFAPRLEPQPMLAPATTLDVVRRDALAELLAPAELPSGTVTEARRRVAHAPKDIEPDPAIVWAAGQDDPARALERWLATPDAPTDWLAEFERSSTRAAAWQATSAHLTDVIARLGPDAFDLLDATASLCDANARAQLAAAFESRVHSDRERRHVTRTLEAIDRCVARRARSGEVAAALAARR